MTIGLHSAESTCSLTVVHLTAWSKPTVTYIFAQWALYLNFDTAAYSLAETDKWKRQATMWRMWLSDSRNKQKLSAVIAVANSLTARTLALVDDAGCSDNDCDKWQRTAVYDMHHACQHLLPSHTLDRSYDSTLVLFESFR